VERTLLSAAFDFDFDFDFAFDLDLAFTTPSRVVGNAESTPAFGWRSASSAAITALG
jgi:hypothetical protein